MSVRQIDISYSKWRECVHWPDLPDTRQWYISDGVQYQANIDQLLIKQA